MEKKQIFNDQTFFSVCSVSSVEEYAGQMFWLQEAKMPAMKTATIRIRINLFIRT
jgi:hypothetical protein